jgi:hypothetical protein
MTDTKYDVVVSSYYCWDEVRLELDEKVRHEFKNVSKSFIFGLLFGNGGRTNLVVDTCIDNEYDEFDFIIGMWDTIRSG